MGKGHFINGKWENGAGKRFSSNNPAFGEVLWSGFEATEEDVHRTFQAAKKAFIGWKNLSLEERHRYLQKFGEILSVEKNNLALTISKETGKPLWESLLEVESVIQKIKISYEAYIQRCSESLKILDKNHLVTRYFPHGCVAVLGPFNFPGHLPHGHILPALLAGDTVVFKGSEYTPLVSEHIFQCWENAYLPQGVINMIQGGKETGEFLATSPLLDGLFFTGSYTTGAWLLKNFSQKPEKILALEMGGNNPLVIESISDPIAVAYLVIQSAYLTAGQRCSCARRLILIEGKETENFLDTLKKLISHISVGAYSQIPEPFMGPVIHKKSRDSLLKTQDLLESQGGKIFRKMEAILEDQLFLSPSLIDVTDIKNRSDEEYFGPILQLVRVKNLEEAIAEANHTRFGLTAGLVSTNEESYKQFLRQMRAGIINWNTPLTGASSRAPFGGIGWSGNHRPSAYFAADYCSYSVASLERPKVILPENILPGISLKDDA
jgi:succinylglutamic semialdehyde dehydrogenase